MRAASVDHQEEQDEEDVQRFVDQQFTVNRSDWVSIGDHPVDKVRIRLVNYAMADTCRLSAAIRDIYQFG